MQSVALISDIHGNLTALTAVLADITARGIGEVFNLGDVAGKGPRGSACVAMVRERCSVTVRGNWDEALSGDLNEQATAADHWWRDELSEDDRAWLGALPLAHDLLLADRRVRLFHASAVSPLVRVFREHTADQFAGMFEATELTGPGDPPDVVCYGDIHQAYLKTDAGRTLVNAGSVGNPLDESTAAYVVLEARESASGQVVGVQFVRVPYDVEAEIDEARSLGMPALTPYAIELRTALYRGLQKLA